MPFRLVRDVMLELDDIQNILLTRATIALTGRCGISFVSQPRGGGPGSRRL